MQKMNSKKHPSNYFNEKIFIGFFKPELYSRYIWIAETMNFIKNLWAILSRVCEQSYEQMSKNFDHLFSLSNSTSIAFICGFTWIFHVLDDFLAHIIFSISRAQIFTEAYTYI